MGGLLPFAISGWVGLTLLSNAPSLSLWALGLFLLAPHSLLSVIAALALIEKEWSTQILRHIYGGLALAGSAVLAKSIAINQPPFSVSESSLLSFVVLLLGTFAFTPGRKSETHGPDFYQRLARTRWRTISYGFIWLASLVAAINEFGSIFACQLAVPYPDAGCAFWQNAGLPSVIGGLASAALVGNAMARYLLLAIFVTGGLFATWHLLFWR